MPFRDRPVFYLEIWCVCIVVVSFGEGGELEGPEGKECVKKRRG